MLSYSEALSPCAIVEPIASMLFQSAGDCHPCSIGFIQDPHCYNKTGHGGRQSKTLVSGQQVRVILVNVE